MRKVIILSLCSIAISIGICSAKKVAPPPVPILRTAGTDDTKDIPIENDDTITVPTKPASSNPKGQLAALVSDIFGRFRSGQGITMNLDVKNPEAFINAAAAPAIKGYRTAVVEDKKKGPLLKARSNRCRRAVGACCTCGAVGVGVAPYYPPAPVYPVYNPPPVYVAPVVPSYPIVSDPEPEGRGSVTINQGTIVSDPEPEGRGSVTINQGTINQGGGGGVGCSSCNPAPEGCGGFGRC